MSSISKIIHGIIFTLSILAWKTVGGLELSNSLLVQIYYSALAATVIIYIASLIFKNVSLYDTYWGLQGALYAITYFQSISNLNYRSLIIIFLSLVWSLRLTFLFILYSWNDIYAEDWRYRFMREKTNNFLKFSIRSGLLHYLLPMNIGFFGHLPLYYILNSTNNQSNMLELFGIFIILFGVVFEAIADSQLRSTVFKTRLNTSKNASGTDASKCMTSGLWSLCRHPNYFGEYLYWLGLYITGLGCGAPIFDKLYIASFIIGSLAVYLVLNYISIPLMEKRQLKRREDAYKNYMQSVKYKFFPLNFM